MEIVILLFACVALPNFTIVGAMNNPIARNPGKGKLHPSNIPGGSIIFIQKVINGEDAPNDFLHGTLAYFEHDNRPAPTGTPMGTVEVHIVDENGHIRNRESESLFTYVWKIKDFENHGKDAFHDLATRYRCSIETEHDDKFYAFLEPANFEVRHNPGDAVVVFFNRLGVPFVGKLHPVVAPSVAALPPSPELDYVPAKRQKTHSAGSSSNSHMMID